MLSRQVMKAMARVQTKDGKQPADMQRLLTANGTVVITNYTPPAPGKKNGGKVRSTPLRLFSHLTISTHASMYAH